MAVGRLYSIWFHVNVDEGYVMSGQREYNRRQRELLNSYKDVEKFLQDVESSQDGANGGARGDDEQSGERHEGLAINLSNIANVVLLVIKVNFQGNGNNVIPPSPSSSQAPLV